MSGDSRNCGDIVMPAIASGVLASRSEFYWHLGDFRAIYAFDEDMVPPALIGTAAQTADHHHLRDHCLARFHRSPVRALWHTSHPAEPRESRDHPARHARTIPAYNLPTGWIHLRCAHSACRTIRRIINCARTITGSIAISISSRMDNAGPDKFDAAQLTWFHSVVDRAEKSPAIQTLVVGMHAALPGQLGRRPQHEQLGAGQRDRPPGLRRVVARADRRAQESLPPGQPLSLLYGRCVSTPLPGKARCCPDGSWAPPGAVRYRLPAGIAARAEGHDRRLRLYGRHRRRGWLGRRLPSNRYGLEDLLARPASGKYPPSLVRWCVDQNKQLTN